MPAQLLSKGIRTVDHKPVVDGPCWARPDTRQAEIANVCIDDVVAFVMADSAGWATPFARVAPDAGLWVDKMLLTQQDLVSLLYYEACQNYAGLTRSKKRAGELRESQLIAPLLSKG